MQLAIVHQMFIQKREASRCRVVKRAVSQWREEIKETLFLRTDHADHYSFALQCDSDK